MTATVPSGVRSKRKPLLADAGFSLTELLIVVSIIGVLVAIVLLNFRSAQIRARIAQARAEMRTLDAALCTYYADQSEFPRGNYFQLSTLYSTTNPEDWGLKRLSTPIAYLPVALLPDPFIAARRKSQRASAFENPAPKDDTDRERIYYKFAAQFWSGEKNTYGTVGTRGNPDRDSRKESFTQWYVLQSTGPSRVRFTLGSGALDPKETPGARENFLATIYDPTNGTHSRGAIYRAGGVPHGARGIATFVFEAIQASQH